MQNFPYRIYAGSLNSNFSLQQPRLQDNAAAAGAIPPRNRNFRSLRTKVFLPVAWQRPTDPRRSASDFVTIDIRVAVRNEIARPPDQPTPSWISIFRVNCNQPARLQDKSQGELRLFCGAGRPPKFRGPF